MPQQINVPGMGVVEFPDGMNDAQITDAIKANMPAEPSVGGALTQGAVGVGKAIIGNAGLPGDLGSLIQTGMEKLGVPENVRQAASNAMPAAVRYLPGAQDIQKTVENYTGPFRQPQNINEERAQTLGEFLPGLIGPGGLARKAITQVALPAAGSQGAAELGRTFLQPQAEPWMRLLGGVGASLLPGALGRAITPFPTTPERTAAVNTLRNEGVTDISAGQATGRKMLQAVENEVGGSRAADLQTNQQEQFTRAALRRTGEDATRATPDVIDNAFTRIGNDFNVAHPYSIQVNRPLINDITNAQANYQFSANPLSKQSFDNAVNDIVTVIQRNNGTIPGDQYLTMRSRLGVAARSAGQDVQLRDGFYDLQHSLDDAMSRTMQAAGRPQDIAALGQARNQYHNLLTIERAVTSGNGPAASEGIISPAALRNAERATQGRRTVARGTGDFSELARAGTQVMAPLPNSGTPIRTSAQNLGMSAVGTGLGLTLAHMLGVGPMEAGALAVGGGYLPKGVGRAMMSGPGQAYLGNQALAPVLNNLPPALRSALISSLLVRPEFALPAPGR